MKLLVQSGAEGEGFRRLPIGSEGYVSPLLQALYSCHRLKSVDTFKNLNYETIEELHSIYLKAAGVVPPVVVCGCGRRAGAVDWVAIEAAVLVAVAVAAVAARPLPAELPSFCGQPQRVG